MIKLLTISLFLCVLVSSWLIKQLVKIRVNSWLSNTQYALRNTHDEIASTTVKNPLQIAPFCSNKANFRKSQMNVTSLITADYVKRTLGQHGKNKPNSNPIQSQTNPTCRGVASGEAGIYHGAASGEAGIYHGVASGEAGIYRGVASGEAGIYHGVASGEAGIYHGVASGEAGIYRGVASGEAGLKPIKCQNKPNSKPIQTQFQDPARKKDWPVQATVFI
jgi:hypothetical protein